MRKRIWQLIGLCVKYKWLIWAAHDLTSWSSGVARQTLEPADQGKILSVHPKYIIFSSSFFSFIMLNYFIQVI